MGCAQATNVAATSKKKKSKLHYDKVSPEQVMFKPFFLLQHAMDGNL